MANHQDSTAVGLTAVIVAVTNEVPRVLVVRRMTHQLAPLAMAGAEEGETVDALPFGPFSPQLHRTLYMGLCNWVEEQTGLPLRYVEQLYTFGGRFRDPREMVGGPRVISIGYIALVREAPLSGSGDAEWRDWYDWFPWEDWRTGRPPVIDQALLPALAAWVHGAADAAEQEQRRERVAVTFGAGDAEWDFERVLERFELLYEAELVAEAPRDLALLAAAGLADAPAPSFDALRRAALKATGTPMALDNRRLLAVALGRLRGKLKYRPLVFDLLPPEFTLYQLQRLVEALSGVRLHKQNFRRLVIVGELVEPTGQLDHHTGGRPAELFQFRRDAMRKRGALGLNLPAIRVQG